MKVIGDYSNNSFTFFSSTDSRRRVELGSVAATTMSKGLLGLLERFDSRYITIQTTDRLKGQLRVHISDLAKILNCSLITLLFAKYNPFGSSEGKIQEALNTHKNIEKVAKQLFSTMGNDQFKISKKLHPFMTHSYVAEKAGETAFSIYRVMRKFSFGSLKSKEVVVGTGATKAAKALTQIETGKKHVLAVNKKADKDLFEQEVKLYEELQGISHVAQGKRVSWINSKNIAKSAILMPHYTYTMDQAKNKISSVKTKCQCALQVALAVQSLFNKELLHFDIKPANVFIDDAGNGSFNAYLGDLGGVRKFVTLLADLLNVGRGFLGYNLKQQNNISTNGMERTPGFCPPETGKINVWKKNDLEMGIIYSLGRTFQEWFGYTHNVAVQSLVVSMVNPNPANRPTIQSVINVLQKYS